MFIDFNDLPLGRLAKTIQDNVAVIYHSAESADTKIIREVRDDELQLSEKYWLNRSSSS